MKTMNPSATRMTDSDIQNTIDYLDRVITAKLRRGGDESDTEITRLIAERQRMIARQNSRRDAAR